MSAQRVADSCLGKDNAGLVIVELVDLSEPQ
jgi:hypothetical protein